MKMMKRFYKDVSVAAQDSGFAILLDGKPIKTPARRELMTKNEALAGLIAAEWEEQNEKIDTESMPVTQLVNTVIDRLAAERDVMRDMVMKFFDTDLICYYADKPPELLTLQKTAWNDAHIWFAGKAGVSLKTTDGLVALKHCDQAHKFIASYVDDLPDEKFVILQAVTPMCGSLVLAGALCDGALTAEQVYKACFVEEDYKSQLYNEDFYGQDPMLEKKRRRTLCDLEASEAILGCLSA